MMNPLSISLCKTIRGAGERQGWWNAPGLLLAVSGGSDSMALLSLLHRCYEGRIAVAHLEHGFRGDASLADAAFVEERCREIGVPCFVRHADLPHNMKKGESFEMAGRRVRYAFFYELLDREGLSFIATGHTADDVVETMLFHLFRGTGLKGLAGIAPVNGRVVRPLIECRRDELRRFLTDAAVAWREDETNLQDDYQRNRIRNQLLPWVRANINESPERVLLGLARQTAASEAKREADARRLLPWLQRRHPFALATWDFAAIGRVDDACLADLLRTQGAALGLPLLDRRRMDELCDLIRAAGRWRFQWSGEVEVCGSRPLIGWIERSDLRAPEDLEIAFSSLRGGEKKSVQWGKWLIELRKGEGSPAGAPRGYWQSAIAVPRSGVLRITSLSGRSGGCRTPVSWWSRPGWPVVENWAPGLGKCIQEESSYVMIAKVFCGQAGRGRYARNEGGVSHERG